LNLFELQEAVNEAAKELKKFHGIAPEDVDVKISTLHPSNGHRGSVNVKCSYTGVDFEKGEFRIDPDEAVIAFDNFSFFKKRKA